LEINPNHANNLGNYAEFLFDIRKDKDKAKKYLLKKSLEIEPDMIVLRDFGRDEASHSRTE